MRISFAVSVLFVACGPDGTDLDGVGDDSGVVAPADPLVNRAPRVELRHLELQEDVAGTGALVGADPEGGPIVWTITEEPLHGRLTLDEAADRYTFEPDPDFFGEDTFELTATDEQDLGTSATVAVTVFPENDPPVAQSPGVLEVRKGGSVTGVVTGFDVEGDALTFSVALEPDAGSVSLDALTGAFLYAAEAGFEGTDRFAVVASDGRLQSPPTQVTLAVLANGAPVLVAPSLVVATEDLPTTGQITGADPDGDVLTYVVSAPAQHGNVTMSAGTGTFAYRPHPDFFGSDAFEVVASDGLLESAPVVVHVDVVPVNDPPTIAVAPIVVASGQSATVTPTLTDVDGDPLTLAVTTAPASGEATVDPNTHVVRYTPDDGFSGVDQIGLRVSDGLATDDAVLTIDVVP